jgi:hypothetical protein
MFTKSSNSKPVDSNSTKPISKIVASYVPDPAKMSVWKRIGRVFLFALGIATLAAIISALSIMTGGAALPAGISLATHLLNAALMAFLEGAAFAGYSELTRQSFAVETIKPLNPVQPRSKVTPVDIDELVQDAKITGQAK